jgi:tetratricopeptide (TPR) repeat protein
MGGRYICFNSNCYLAGAVNAAGERDRADTLFGEALETAHAQGDPYLITRTLDSMALTAFHRGDGPAMMRLTRDGVFWSRKFGEPRLVATALNNAAATALINEDHATARALLEEALALNRQGANADQKTTCLSNLGEIALRQGDYESARGYYGQSLKLLWRLGQRPVIQITLNSLGTLAAAQGRPERAARLWGAGEGAREVLGLSLVLAPTERADYERQVSETRALLGEEGFAVAWAQGRAMTLEQAVAFALEEEANGGSEPGKTAAPSP